MMIQEDTTKEEDIQQTPIPQSYPEVYQKTGAYTIKLNLFTLTQINASYYRVQTQPIIWMECLS